MLAIVTAAAKESSGNFLVSPSLGLMIWALLAFGITWLILRKLAFPRIQEALDRRQNAIEESIAHAERMRAESDQLLASYRQRLEEARAQSEEIVARARKAGEQTEREAIDAAKRHREELLDQTRSDIAAETRRAIQEIRNEVASLTIQATEKVTSKTLTGPDHQRLVEEALAELDFSRLAGAEQS